MEHELINLIKIILMKGVQRGGDFNLHEICCTVIYELILQRTVFRLSQSCLSTLQTTEQTGGSASG